MIELASEIWNYPQLVIICSYFILLFLYLNMLVFYLVFCVLFITEISVFLIYTWWAQNCTFQQNMGLKWSLFLRHLANMLPAAHGNTHIACLSHQPSGWYVCSPSVSKRVLGLVVPNYFNSPLLSRTSKPDSFKQ